MILLVTTVESDPVGLLRLVAVLLLCGTVLDTADGPVARRWGGSPLGAPLDNLADCVTFGVAPAVALAVLASSGATPVENGLLVVGALVYVAGALLRLADFSAVRHDQPGFTGLPSPLAATCAIVFGFLSPTPWAAALALVVLGAAHGQPRALPRAARGRPRHLVRRLGGVAGRRARALPDAGTGHRRASR